MDRYKAYEVGDMVSCGIVNTLPSALKAFVMKPDKVFILGAFMCACATLAEAEAIAASMNAIEAIRHQISPLPFDH